MAKKNRVWVRRDNNINAIIDEITNSVATTQFGDGAIAPVTDTFESTIDIDLTLDEPDEIEPTEEELAAIEAELFAKKEKARQYQKERSQEPYKRPIVPKPKHNRETGLDLFNSLEGTIEAGDFVELVSVNAFNSSGNLMKKKDIPKKEIKPTAEMGRKRIDTLIESEGIETLATESELLEKWGLTRNSDYIKCITEKYEGAFPPNIETPDLMKAGDMSIISFERLMSHDPNPDTIAVADYVMQQYLLLPQKLFRFIYIRHEKASMASYSKALRRYIGLFMQDNETAIKLSKLTRLNNYEGMYIKCCVKKSTE